MKSKPTTTGRHEYSERIDQTAFQMMKCGKNSIDASPNQRKHFKQRHLTHIEWSLNNLPRYSVAVTAVIAKCLIKYDKEHVGKFCRALKLAFFEGKDDPAMLLWKFLKKNHGQDTTTVYYYTVCAAKAYMEGRKLRTLQCVKRDIFDWDEDWTVPDELIPNWNPEEVPMTDSKISKNEPLELDTVK